MKTRSKNLYEFLESSGVLEKGEAAIQAAKREYRKAYKREWKKASAKKKNELRLLISTPQYKRLQWYAKLYGVKPTPCARTILLAALEGTPRLPQPELVKEILQRVSRAVNHTDDESAKQLLLQAESLLMEYIQAYGSD